MGAYRDVALTEHTMARVDYAHEHVTFLEPDSAVSASAALGHDRAARFEGH